MSFITFTFITEINTRKKVVFLPVLKAKKCSQQHYGSQDVPGNSIRNQYLIPTRRRTP